MPEYSGTNYTACPVIGNRSSGLLETVIPEEETACYSFIM